MKKIGEERGRALKKWTWETYTSLFNLVYFKKYIQKFRTNLTSVVYIDGIEENLREKVRYTLTDLSKCIKPFKISFNRKKPDQIRLKSWWRGNR